MSRHHQQHEHVILIEAKRASSAGGMYRVYYNRHGDSEHSCLGVRSTDFGRSGREGPSKLCHEKKIRKNTRTARMQPLPAHAQNVFCGVKQCISRQNIICTFAYESEHTFEIAKTKHTLEHELHARPLVRSQPSMHGGAIHVTLELNNMLQSIVSG